MQQTSCRTNSRRRRARICGSRSVFFVFGAAVAWLAFRMPRYADQKGEIYTAPGLVPGFYGVVMFLLSIWLAVRAVRQGALQATAEGDAAPSPRGPAICAWRVPRRSASSSSWA